MCSVDNIEQVKATQMILKEKAEKEVYHHQIDNLKIKKN